MKKVKKGKELIFAVPTTQTGFTEKDLNSCVELVKLEAFPHLYGEELPKALTFTGDFGIVDYKHAVTEHSLTFGTQQIGARRGTKNPKYDEIWRHIRDFDFKLRNPPICALRHGGELFLINGRTRAEILVSKFGFENLIVAFYEVTPGYTPSQVADCISQFGIIANTDEDPSGSAQIYDVYEEVVNAIVQGWIVNPQEVDEEVARTAIKDRIETLCGSAKGRFGDVKRDQILYQILNHFDPINEVRWWNHHSAKAWMTQEAKYYNIDPIYEDATKKILKKRGIIYKVISANAAHKGILDVVYEASNNPHSEIRVVLHTGTLEGYNLDNCYDIRVLSFVTFYDEVLSKFGSVFFSGQKADMTQVKVYGALPALGPRHNLKKLVLIKPGLTTIVQSAGESKDYFYTLTQSNAPSVSVVKTQKKKFTLIDGNHRNQMLNNVFDIE